ncbi:MAG: adenylyltransferase/cytidyltransferase family protein [Bdellovibrionales bacterium]|nr:adenylyltransferase/cytidyltransferase family protein [Bdellovibrionales bacterium]
MPAKKGSVPDYRRKIKTREEVRALIGDRPRKKTVIMCHGTFDIVHPGHVRHLMYCRDKADILIASLTPDNYIPKSNFRPFVPQELRAMNLAALEAVDYVVIDDNPAPLEQLKIIQPDFYAKGYEYFKDNVHPKTREEIEVLDSFGGEIIFTPGDVVYSSSKLLDTQPPGISLDKLLSLMSAEGLTFNSLRETLDKFSDKRVHVVGDTIVDSYTYCSLIGGGTKTPTLSVKYENQIDYVGGAAIVAKHMKAAGANVIFSTVLGDDPLKDFVMKDLEADGVTCQVIVDRTRPTTHKNFIISGGYRLIKIDKLDNRTISDKILGKIRNQVAETKADAVVFSDFRHGMFSPVTIPQLTEAIPKDTFKVADSQVASRWGNILDFQGFDLITPNEKEARFALGDQDSVIRPLALNLYHKANCKNLILKMGERGLIGYRRESLDPRAFFTVDSFAENVKDAVGSGDALLAYATLAHLCTQSSVIAAILGSIAAALAVENDGNKPVPPEDVRKRIDLMEKRAAYNA